MKKLSPSAALAQKIDYIHAMPENDIEARFVVGAIDITSRELKKDLQQARRDYPWQLQLVHDALGGAIVRLGRLFGVDATYCRDNSRTQARADLRVFKQAVLPLRAQMIARMDAASLSA